jgi:hypothetical protein
VPTIKELEPEAAMTTLVVDTCAFLPCDQVDACCLPGGCIAERFQAPRPKAHGETLKKGARALAGAKPSRFTGRK